MQNHNDDTIIKTSDTVLLEKYTSHFIWKGCVWEGVGDRTELQHTDPHSYGHQHFFPVLLGCSTGGLGPSLSGCWFSLPHLISNWSGLQTAQSWRPEGSLYHILSPTGLVSKLTDFLSSLSYIIVQCPPSCGRHNPTHSTRPWSRLYSDIPWADAPVIYIGAFPILTAQPGRRSIYNIYTWFAKWVVCLREKEKRVMATLTPQFKIKWNLEWGEFVRVAYVFHCSQVAKSILWTVIGCWSSEWLY